MPRRKPQPAEELPCALVCGNCHFVEFFDEDRDEGECYATPPQVVASDEEGVISARPTVGAGDKACIHFKLRLQS